VDVRVVGAKLKDIPARARDQDIPVTLVGLAELRHLDLPPRRGWPAAIAPELVDQALSRDTLVRFDEAGSEKRAALPRAQPRLGHPRPAPPVGPQAETHTFRRPYLVFASLMRASYGRSEADDGPRTATFGLGSRRSTN